MPTVPPGILLDVPRRLADGARRLMVRAGTSRRARGAGASDSSLNAIPWPSGRSCGGAPISKRRLDTSAPGLRPVI